MRIRLAEAVAATVGIATAGCSSGLPVLTADAGTDSSDAHAADAPHDAGSDRGGERAPADARADAGQGREAGIHDSGHDSTVDTGPDATADAALDSGSDARTEKDVAAPRDASAEAGGCAGNCVGGSCEGGTCVCDTGKAACGGTCIDVQSDSNNCGTCGRTCQGDVCSAGLCPATTIAIINIAPVHMIVDSTHVFWSNSGGNTDSCQECVSQANKDGTGIIGIIGVNYPYGLAQSGATVFSSALYAGSTQPVAEGTENVASNNPGDYSSEGGWGRALTSDATYLYWTTNDGRIQRNTLVAPVAVPQTLVTGESSGLNGAALESVTVDSNYIYWIDTVLNLIRRAPLTGGTGQTLGTANGPTNVVLAGEFLYWGAANEFTISRIATTADAGAAAVVVGNASAPVAIAVDAAHIYWIDGANLWRANFDGTGVFELAKGYTALVDLAVDDTSVFLLGPGNIVRVAK